MASLEAAMEDEAKQIMELLEKNSPPSVRTVPQVQQRSGRASSPYTQSPVRSMLDIGNGKTTGTPSTSTGPRSGSGLARPMQSQQIRSMLDITSPPVSSPLAAPRSAAASPTEATHREEMLNKAQHRSMSDAAARYDNLSDQTLSGYQFGNIMSNNPGGPVVPKRNTQAAGFGSRKKGLSAMAEVLKGDISSFGGRDSGRHHSIAGVPMGNTAKSRSPHNRLGQRSSSPNLDPTKFQLYDGTILDVNNAYRKLSDANLARARGSLAVLGQKSARRASGGDAMARNGGRLEKDYDTIDGEDAVADSSDEDNMSSDDDRHRGRKGKSLENESETTLGMGRAKGPRIARSLMAAAEEERIQVSKYPSKVRSLLDIDPNTTVTASSGSRSKSSKDRVHPRTSYDDYYVPVGPDEKEKMEQEQIEDMKTAQTLNIKETAITSTPHSKRCVKTVIRGDFLMMQKESQENQRRVRTYLVATDLSDEATHALEWAIGTVLRDGDTLLAIYCVDEEVGVGVIPADAIVDERSVQEQVAAVVAEMGPPTSTPRLSPVPDPSLSGPGSKSEANSARASPSPGGERVMSKEEKDRHKAVNDIALRVVRLLRQTKLEVKVVIEVIHCKTPKHLITEIIDHVNPTLVILGSRGRSALKGVILGSFSNYLVTKSSVPVMVARKKLHKTTKLRNAVQQANVLTNTTGTDAWKELDVKRIKNIG